MAVRADAHYTRLFDGTTSHFCSLSIGAIESRLEPRLFVRVHRSHIDFSSSLLAGLTLRKTISRKRHAG